jgi:hypothetical protein
LRTLKFILNQQFVSSSLFGAQQQQKSWRSSRRKKKDIDPPKTKNVAKRPRNMPEERRSVEHVGADLQPKMERASKHGLPVFGNTHVWLLALLCEAANGDENHAESSQPSALILQKNISPTTSPFHFVSTKSHVDGLHSKLKAPNKK